MIESRGSDHANPFGREVQKEAFMKIKRRSVSATKAWGVGGSPATSVTNTPPRRNPTTPRPTRTRGRELASHT